MPAVVIAVVSFLSGTLGGWWLTMVVVTASISFSQERMERKVRYWQAETARARAEADRGPARSPPRLARRSGPAVTGLTFTNRRRRPTRRPTLRCPAGQSPAAG